MGRSINLEVWNPDGASARVLVVGNHRAAVPTPEGVTCDIAQTAHLQAAERLAVGCIESANPDGVYTSDGRTVLGIDLVADHRTRRASETVAIHDAVSKLNADVIIDIGKREGVQRPTADLEVSIRYFDAPSGSVPEWIALLGSEIRRRMRTSHFTVEVSMTRAESSSITSVTGVPVVEVTATAPPHMSSPGRSAAGLVEAGVAACGAAVVALEMVPGLA